MSSSQGWGWWPYRMVDWRGFRVHYSREGNGSCFEPIFFAGTDTISGLLVAYWARYV